jgi:hypothetical protein
MHLDPPSSSSTPTSPLGSACRDIHTSAPVTHVPERLGSHLACCGERLYGPHTSTIRMNPYVRCVHGSGVPEIRSLKELLSLKNQPAPAEPDTPCLRPTHGPASTWQAPGDAAAKAAPMGAGATGGSARPFRHASSPVLAFTADSVATPNTFATVVTHEKRIISNLTRRLRNSVRRHQDMPFGESMEMVLSEGDAEEDGGNDDGEGAETEEEAVTNGSKVTGDNAAVDDAERGDADVGEVPMLPCSTRDKAAEAEAAAAAASGASSIAHGTARATSTTSSNSSRSNTTTAETTPSHSARSQARSCTPSPMQDEQHQKQQQHQQQQQWLMQVSNERIVSPHSSSGILCEFPGSQLSAAEVRHRQPPQHAHSASNQQSLPSSHQRGPLSRNGLHLYSSLPSPMASAALLSYPAPVAKLEESPYHYIMRNYIGGTFLYYSTAESKEYFLRLCHRVVAQVRPLLEQETLSPHHGLFPRINAPAYIFGDIHGNFEDLSFFLKRLLIFHDFNLTPANILCLGDYVDRGPFSLECVMLLFSLKIMNASKIVMLRGNHEDRVVCGDLQTYGRGCFLGQCQTVFGYSEGMKLFKEVTALFKYLPLAAELVIPSTPNIAFLRSQQTVMHPNLYVSQPAVLLHDAAAVEAPQTSTPVAARPPHPGGEVASGDSGDDVLSKSTASLPPTPSATLSSSTTGESAASVTTAAGYSTIADASLARGQPSRHEAHEERILCTHGGIPRFDRPPLEENALNSLRSLAFPRMLTLFPNNPMVMDDPECAPDYFVRMELQTLWRRYPSMAPAEFTAMSRREEAEASAALNNSGLLRGYPIKTRKLTSSASCGNEEGQASLYTIAERHERGRSDSVSSAASSNTSLPSAPLYDDKAADGALHTHRPLLQRCSSRDFLPLTSDEDVRKAWYTMFDLLWSDPTPMESEEESTRAGVSAATDGTAARATYINEWGFGINTRGSNVVSFSAKAVDTFLTAHHYSMLFRAHQEKAHGLRWSKSNKVLTIFSSSNYMGHGNGAGCVVVAANGEVQMVEKVCMY